MQEGPPIQGRLGDPRPAGDPPPPLGVPATARLVTLPYSEVCMHMRVAGQITWVSPVPGNMAQLWTWRDSYGWQKFSMPITRGEAGLNHTD